MRKTLTILLTILAATAAPAFAAGPAPTPAPVGPDDLKTAVLAAHNAERHAVGVPDLVWSDALAARAATWAQHLVGLGRLQHSPQDTRGDTGENLAMGTAGRYTPADMMAGWVSEKASFKSGMFPSVSTTGSRTAVGHYTQMVWRDTTEVGCATASSADWDVLVCRYSPSGNVAGKAVY